MLYGRARKQITRAPWYRPARQSLRAAFHLGVTETLEIANLGYSYAATSVRVPGTS